VVDNVLSEAEAHIIMEDADTDADSETNADTDDTDDTDAGTDMDVGTDAGTYVRFLVVMVGCHGLSDRSRGVNCATP
jgi:hypothetical protein